LGSVHALFPSARAHTIPITMPSTNKGNPKRTNWLVNCSVASKGGSFSRRVSGRLCFNDHNVSKWVTVEPKASISIKEPPIKRATWMSKMSRLNSDGNKVGLSKLPKASNVAAKGKRKPKGASILLRWNCKNATAAPNTPRATVTASGKSNFNQTSHCAFGKLKEMANDSEDKQRFEERQ